MRQICCANLGQCTKCDMVPSHLNTAGLHPLSQRIYVMVVPVVSLLILGLKQSTKHTAKGISSYCRDHPWLNKYFAMLGRRYHRITVRLQGRCAMWSDTLCIKSYGCRLIQGS